MLFFGLRLIPELHRGRGTQFVFLFFSATMESTAVLRQLKLHFLNLSLPVGLKILHKWRRYIFSALLLTIYLLWCIEKCLVPRTQNKQAPLVQQCKSCCQCCYCWCVSATSPLIMSDSCCEMPHRVLASLGQQVGKHKNIEFWKWVMEKNPLLYATWKALFEFQIAPTKW